MNQHVKRISTRKLLSLAGILLISLPHQAIAQSNAREMQEGTLKQTEKAITSNTISLTLHTVAAGVCLAACYGTFGIGSGGCTAASIGATVADLGLTIALEQNAQAVAGAVSFAGVGTLALLQSSAERAKISEANFANNATNGEGAAGGDGAPGADAGDGGASGDGGTTADANSGGENSNENGSNAACFVPVITETLQAVMKGAMLGQAVSMKKELKTNIQSLTADSNQVLISGATDEGGQAEAPSAEGGTGTASAELALGDESVGDDRGCGSAKNSGSGKEFIQCAVANGISIPPALQGINLNDPSIDKQIGDLLKAVPDDGNTAGLANVIASGTGGNVDAANLKSTLDGVQANIVNSDALEQYAAANDSTYGGGGGGQKSGNNPLDFGALLKDTLGNVQNMFGAGAEKAKEKKKGVFELVYQKMTPEQVAKSRELSLFDRIEFRYSKNKTNLREIPFASPYNKAIVRSGQNERSVRTPASTRSSRQ